MMSLHSSKELALIQLTNCMPSCDVQTIKQLSDGKLFLSIIETVFPEKTLNLQSEEKQTSHGHEHSKDEDEAMDQDSNMYKNDSQKELDSVVESSKETEPATNDESIASQNNHTAMSSEFIDDLSVIKSSEQTTIDGKDVISSGEDKSSPPPPVKNVDEKDENLSKRYEFVECFIDEKYNLQSGRLISYKECMTANEFELAKVTLFIVSEIVRHYVRLNDAVIQTLSHLDIKVQQDLEDCFNLFINERAKITETDINRLLSRPAAYKVSPSKSSFVTPKRSCSSKYKWSPSASPILDTVFIDSPLKTYFESPIFTKKDIITKEREIRKTRQTLYEEEIKSSNLQLTVKELEKKLKSKDKEINSLKTRIKELQETEKLEDCEECAILGSSLKKSEKQLHELKSLMEEQLETLRSNYEEKLEKFRVQLEESFSSVYYEARVAEDRCEKLEAELDDIKFELLKGEQHITHLTEEWEEKTKECEITKEKLSAALIELEKIPECSIRGESIGGVIEKENEELRQRIKQLEIIALSKEKAMVDAMVSCTEDNFDCKVMENAIVSTNELPPTPIICEKTESVIISEKPNGCPIVCDMEKQDSLTLNSTGPTDTVPLTLNEINQSPIKNDCVGALWQQYNDSMTENERTSEGHLLEKCVNKVMSSLQKFETQFPKQNHKHFKITSRANGSNGLVSPPVLKELNEDLKSLKKTLSCLSQVENSDVKFQNSILISNSCEVINGKDCDSNLAVNSTCDTCLKKKEELPSSVLSSVSQDSAALLEKTKEFDILNQQYLTTEASLRLKEKEVNVYKKKYILEKREYLRTVKILRELEISCQKLQLELKDVRRAENDMKMVMKKEKSSFKHHMMEMMAENHNLLEKGKALQADFKTLYKRNQKLEDDVVSYRTRNDELKFHIKILENQVKELGHRLKFEQEQGNIETRIVPCIQGPVEHFEQVIPKTEPLSPTECEASSLNSDIEGNMTASALYTRSLQNPFHLHTADEESFLNHSSIAGSVVSRNYESEDSLNRVQELNRRNTLCMPQCEAYNIHNQNRDQIAPNRAMELNRRNTLCLPHMKSCYPAEGVPLNPPNRHLSNYVDFETHEDAKNDSELENKKPAGKKRKVTEMKAEDQTSEVVSTPSRKMKIKFKTPQSLTKLLKLPGRRNRRVATIKPKPE